MPASCTFELNGKPVSTLKCDNQSFSAFSGRGKAIDSKDFIASKDLGPLPTGRYYIVDRKSGGLLGGVYDTVGRWFGSDKSHWFALYRDDDKVDDETVINGVLRGSFRLHPIGPRGISEGCITLTSKDDFERLRTYLLNQKMDTVPGTDIKYYGTVDVQ